LTYVRSEAIQWCHDGAGFIYFVQAGNHGPIKIGITDNVRRRLKSLQSSSPEPLRLLFSFNGSEVIESALHQKFSSCRMHGEWFRPTTELVSFISTLSAELTSNP
jgi:hypothetical protein